MAALNEIIMLAAIENLEIQEGAQRRRAYYNRYDPFELNDRQFIKMFRLNKVLVERLIELVRPYMQPPTLKSALSIKTKVLVTLHFCATGSYQLPVGKNLHLSVSQSSVSRCVTEVIQILNRPEIFNEWVRFPRNMEELNEVRQKGRPYEVMGVLGKQNVTGGGGVVIARLHTSRLIIAHYVGNVGYLFYNKFHMPGVIGCIDCTHVAIYPPKTDDPVHPEYIFINRKNYHSINTQLICDSSLRILHVNARFPGSCHDSHIWNSSNVEPVLRNIFNRGNEGYFLLGDSGYALRPWLLTPLQNPQGNNEETYNRIHKSTRATIERCNGLLKMRFRCLLKHRVLHYSPEKASQIINACTVLHNMCIDNNLELILDEGENEGELDFGLIDVEPINDENIGRGNPELALGRRIQRRVINRMV